MSSLSSSDKFEIQFLMGVAKVSIPGQRNSKQMLLLSFWLIYWLLILVFILFIGNQVINAFRAGQTNIFIFIMGFAAFFGTLTWGMRGMFAIYVLLWQIAGLETLEISHDTLKLRKTIFGVGKTKEFEKN